MRVMTPHSIPVFLGNSGIGSSFGPLPALIRDFDVFYKDPILVGFHIVGAVEQDILSNFVVTIEETSNAPQVFGFYGESPELPPGCRPCW